ncbi:MAG: hypothetical protein KC731_22515 [Myxococcales bacterium]|nr:hypothetical protein [Myxococcales bacterium]
MRFMIMHKLTAKLEEGLPPSPEQIAEIHGLMGEAAAAGIMLDGEGLLPSRERWHVAYRDGERTVTKGPFVDQGELIASFARLKVKSEEEAFSWLDRFAAILGDVELFLGPCTEPWDLGMAPKPDNPPLRLLALQQATERSEAGLPSTPEQMAQMSALIEEMSAAGVLQSTQALAGSAQGARVFVEDGQHSIVDGPFAESKELISGFAVFELPSKAEAIEWAIRWAHVVKVHQVEVRQLAD